MSNKFPIPVGDTGTSHPWPVWGHVPPIDVVLQEADTLGSHKDSERLQELGAGLLQAPARVKNLINIVIAGDEG